MELSEYLKKYENLPPPHDALRGALVKAIEDEIGITIEKKHIHVRRNCVSVDAASHLKNTIFVKREKLLKNLEHQLGKLYITDIR